MSYIDGFVIAVPTANREAFLEMAKRTSAVFLKHGATQVVESWGDDVPHGKQTDFFRAVQATPEETVVFAWITWPSKAIRDAGMAKVMADPDNEPDAMRGIFDGKRMIYGGFTPLLDERAKA